MSTRISTKSLLFQAKGRSFFQEASSIPEVCKGPMPRRITLVSQWTGMEIEMECTGPRIVHGEMVDWTYRPINKDAPIRNIVILND